MQNGLWHLEDPTSQQSAFVSVVMGVMTGVFGIWMGHEHKEELKNETSIDRSSITTKAS